jgi:hypothetical protein
MILGTSEANFGGHVRNNNLPVQSPLFNAAKPLRKPYIRVSALVGGFLQNTAGSRLVAHLAARRTPVLSIPGVCQ